MTRAVVSRPLSYVRSEPLGRSLGRAMAKVFPDSASTDFSTQHFWSAQIFADHALELEREHSGGRREADTYARHQAYASGCVLCCVAFLEAYINELFEHCALTLGGAPIDGLARDDQATLGRMWRRGIPRTARYAVLEKYDIALDLLGKATFEPGVSPYQGASALVALRNALIHYEPDFYPVPGPGRPVDPAAAPALEKRLRGKFALNPFAREGYGFFPDHCLSAGCCAWALEASFSFAMDFIGRMGIVERWKAPLASAPPRE